jgi:hypothetical protein
VGAAGGLLGGAAEGLGGVAEDAFDAIGDIF